jgi:hypothetical protein
MSDSKNNISQQEAAAFQALKQEIERLRDLVVSLTASLQRAIALDSIGDHRSASSADAEHLLRNADECFGCARQLEAAGHDFMKKAVEIETIVQRRKWKK